MNLIQMQNLLSKTLTVAGSPPLPSAMEGEEETTRSWYNITVHIGCESETMNKPWRLLWMNERQEIQWNIPSLWNWSVINAKKTCKLNTYTPVFFWVTYAIDCYKNKKLSENACVIFQLLALWAKQLL